MLKQVPYEVTQFFSQRNVDVDMVRWVYLLHISSFKCSSMRLFDGDKLVTLEHPEGVEVREVPSVPKHKPQDGEAKPKRKYKRRGRKAKELD